MDYLFSVEVFGKSIQKNLGTAAYRRFGGLFGVGTGKPAVVVSVSMGGSTSSGEGGEGGCRLFIPKDRTSCVVRSVALEKRVLAGGKKEKA